MHYYEVLIRSNRYHGSDALTYSSPEELAVGTIVRVPLQREAVTGVVSAKTSKPQFQTKAITSIEYQRPLPTQLLDLAFWVQKFYPVPLGVVMQQFLPATPPTKKPAEQITKVSSPVVLPDLTPAQERAFKTMLKTDTYLLHGKTGSGKTRLYIELITRELSLQKSAILLTPEIGLTSQLISILEAVFDDKVVLLHSQLTPRERASAWFKILSSSEPLVVVGPRSALFSPVKTIGMIIMDEFHEPAYKQEQLPHYQTIRVASKLASLHGASLVLGSATPSITEYYLAEQKHKPIIRLNELAKKSEHGVTHIIVDLRNRALFSRSKHLSDDLLKQMEVAFQNGEQTMLYLNRRGTARSVLCDQCGWHALCPHCDIPLTYHDDAFELQCHTCGYHQKVPFVCPECQNPSIIFKVVGTKAIVKEVERLFPEARIMRFDTDNKKAERLEQHLPDLQAGTVDIVVGTQLLAKGLDLPRLSTLGVLLADSSLTIPDFSAQERTYQLLNQVLGRIGRGHVAGHAFIQTYQPDLPALRAAIADDWETFYTGEIVERKKYLFPPFCYILKLTCRRASSTAASSSAEKFKLLLQGQPLHIRIEGPAPAFHEKFQNKHQWQLIIKATDRAELLKVIALLPKSGWTYDIDPLNLL